MKRAVSIILAFCLVLSLFSLTGCSNSDTAALKELNSEEHEWEHLFTAESDDEVLMIFRRHVSFFIFHHTVFKITVYNDGVCTYFYESTAVPCKNGFWFCNEKYAEISDACRIDGVFASLFPYIETVYANDIMTEIIEGQYKDDIGAALFIDNSVSYLTDYQDDIEENIPSAGIGIGASCNDYVSKAVEVIFGVEEAKNQYGETKEAETPEEYAMIIMPWLSEIEKGTKTSLNRIAFEHGKALVMLDSLSGHYTPGNITLTNYTEEFAAVEKELVDKFKYAMDDIDIQKAEQAEKKKKRFEKMIDDYLSC